MRIRYVRQLTEKEALKMARENPLHLKFVKGQTPGMAMEAVKADWRALRYVENRTPEMEAEAIRQNPDVAGMLKSLGDPKPASGEERNITYSRELTEEQAIGLVTKTPYNLEFINEPTDSVREAALKADAWVAIDHIPRDRMTPEWKMIAAQAGCLGKIEDPTYEMCLASVGKRGQTLRFVSKEMRTPELLEAAVEQDPAGALYCMGPDEKTPELCRKAVMKDGKALEFVDGPMQTKQMCLAAIGQDPDNIMHAARQLEDLCLEAVRRKGEAIEYVRAPSKKVCLKAVRNDPEALKRVRYGHPSLNASEDMLEVYVEAVKLKPDMEDNFGELDEDMLKEAKEIAGKLKDETPRQALDPMADFDACVAAVERDGLALRDVTKPEEKHEEFRERLCEKGRQAEDEPIELHFKRYRKLCECAVNQNPMALEFVDKDVMWGDEYRDICSTAVRRDPMALRFADKSGQSSDTIRGAILDEPMSIQYAWRQESDLCSYAADHNGYVLQFIRKQTPELCMMAVNRTPHALKFVKKQTREICRAAVEKDPTTQWYVKDKSILEGLDLSVPERNDTDNMRKVRMNGYELGEIPESERTPEVCMIALEQNPYALKFVPDPTLDMYLLGLKEDYTILRKIQEKMPEALDADAYMRAVRNNPHCFKDVPDEFKTEAMCLHAVRHHGDGIGYVPKSLATEEMCVEAVRNQAMAINSVYAAHPGLATEEVCFAAVEKDPTVFQYIHRADKTEELCLYAVGRRGMNLTHVPDEMRTQEMDRIALENEPDVARFVEIRLDESTSQGMRM